MRTLILNPLFSLQLSLELKHLTSVNAYDYYSVVRSAYNHCLTTTICIEDSQRMDS